jgi:hypothetical protein
MLKIEYIWRELLFQAIERKNPEFTITDLANKFHLSTSMVSHAILPLRELSMVEVGKLKSRVVDTEKLLYFWATRKNINKDIIYKTYINLSVFKRENAMPAIVFPTAYSACRLYYRDLPSDYENIYFYANDSIEIKKRFPEYSKKNPNIFIIQQDPYLKIYKKTPIAQIFSDLWNLPEWYAKEFSNSILQKIKSQIGI